MGLDDVRCNDDLQGTSVQSSASTATMYIVEKHPMFKGRAKTYKLQMHKTTAIQPLYWPCIVKSGMLLCIMHSSYRWNACLNTNGQRHRLSVVRCYKSTAKPYLVERQETYDETNLIQHSRALLSGFFLANMPRVLHKDNGRLGLLGW